MDPYDEAIVKKFGRHLDEYLDIHDNLEENQQEKSNGVSRKHVSKAQEHEFKLAFNLVAAGEPSIIDAQVNDLFLGIGYTVQDSELDTLLEKCLRVDNRLSYDILIEAYSGWKKEQTDEKYLEALFMMLAEKGRVLPKFPVEYLRKGKPKKMMNIDEATLMKVMVQANPKATLYKDGDVLKLVDEIACSAKGTENPKNPYVIWEDFLKLFRK